jgi:hypothetical protein
MLINEIFKTNNAPEKADDLSASMGGISLKT